MLLSFEHVFGGRWFYEMVQPWRAQHIFFNICSLPRYISMCRSFVCLHYDIVHQCSLQNDLLIFRIVNMKGHYSFWRFSDFKKLSSGSSKLPTMQRDLLLLLPLLVLDYYSTAMTATTPAASLKKNIAGFWQLSILTLLEWPSFLGSAKAASGTSPRVLAAAWRVRLSLSCKQETISGMFFLSPCWDPAKKSFSIHSSTEA